MHMYTRKIALHYLRYHHAMVSFALPCWCFAGFADVRHILTSRYIIMKTCVIYTCWRHDTTWYLMLLIWYITLTSYWRHDDVMVTLWWYNYADALFDVDADMTAQWHYLSPLGTITLKKLYSRSVLVHPPIWVWILTSTRCQICSILDV